MHWDNNEAGHDENQIQKGNQNEQQDSNNKSLIPLTIRLINQATDNGGTFVLDDNEIHQLTIIAQIIESNILDTNAKYTITDGTGIIEANIYNEEDNSDWKVGQYVRIIGSIQVFQENRSILAFRIKPVVDENEITYHFLNVLFNHFYRTKGNLPEDNSEQITNNSTINNYNNNNYNNNNYNNNNNNYNNNNNNNNHDQNDNNFNQLKERIIDVIQSNGDPNIGMHVDQICDVLCDEASREMIINEIEFLQTEGHLYPTNDGYFQLANK